MCFFSLNEAYAINSVIFSLSLMALSFVDDYVDDVEPVPDNLPELLDFAEDLDEGFLFSSFSLTKM